MKQARVLSHQELKRVLTVAAAGKHGQRNCLALLLSYFTGLRVGEIASLRWSDLLDDDHTVKAAFYLEATNTKSGEARAVHLNQILRREIATYLVSCNTTLVLASPVICSQKGHAFSANSLCQLFGRLYAAAGITDASSHSGRRWFITQLAHKGVSSKVIMELAGHKNLGTTQRYIEVNEEMKKQAVSLL